MADDKRQNELTMADADSGQEDPGYDAPVRYDNDYAVRIVRDGYISCQRVS